MEIEWSKHRGTERIDHTFGAERCHFSASTNKAPQGSGRTSGRRMNRKKTGSSVMAQRDVASACRESCNARCRSLFCLGGSSGIGRPVQAEALKERANVLIESH